MDQLEQATRILGVMFVLTEGSKEKAVSMGEILTYARTHGIPRMSNAEFQEWFDRIAGPIRDRGATT